MAPRRRAASLAAAASAFLLGVAVAAAKSSPSLTTRDGLIVDAKTGKEVVMKGANWFGWNTALDATGNFTNGADAVAQDARWATARLAMMGFNAVRVPFVFRDVAPGRRPYNYTRLCGVPSQDDAKLSSVVPPPASRPTAIPAATRSPQASSSSRAGGGSPGVKVPLRLPSQDFPELPMAGLKGVCNADMPQLDARERFLWNVEVLVKQGLYVMLDYHPGIDIAGAERTILDVDAFVAGWKDVLSSVLEAVPESRGRLLVDLLNEPDAFSLTWNTAGGPLSVKSPSPDPKGFVTATPLPGNARPSLDALYLAALDALYPLCPECVFLVEGGGQASVPGVHWGNGFVSDVSLASQRGIQTPQSFFEKALDAPWLKQLALAPHIYCPRVSGAVDCFRGGCLFDSLDRSFGVLTKGQGFCSSSSSSSANSNKKGTSCHVFPAVIGELGSTLENERESSCMSSVVDWVTATGDAASSDRVPYRSVFWWAWNPDSEDTGGLVELRDWRTISWPRFEVLTGGTKKWSRGLGLRPWYLEGFTGAVALSASTKADSPSPPTTATTSRKALRGDGRSGGLSSASPGAVAVAVGIPLLCVVAVVSSALVWRASARAERLRLAAASAASASKGGGSSSSPSWAEAVPAGTLSSSSVKGNNINNNNNDNVYNYPPPPPSVGFGFGAPAPAPAAAAAPPPLPPPHVFPSASAVPLAFAPTRGGDAAAAAVAVSSSSSPRFGGVGGSGASTPRSRRARGFLFGGGAGGERGQ